MISDTRTKIISGIQDELTEILYHKPKPETNDEKDKEKDKEKEKDYEITADGDIITIRHKEQGKMGRIIVQKFVNKISGLASSPHNIVIEFDTLVVKCIDFQEEVQSKDKRLQVAPHFLSTEWVFKGDIKIKQLSREEYNIVFDDPSLKGISMMKLDAQMFSKFKKATISLGTGSCLKWYLGGYDADLLTASNVVLTFGYFSKSKLSNTLKISLEIGDISMQGDVSEMIDTFQQEISRMM